MPEFSCWEAMRQRCLNTNAPNFASYGGRGITVCDAWKESFRTFLADMGPRPSIAHSIDRINNEGNYEPSNCRWATPEQQNKNRRDNLPITAFGKTMILQDWAKEIGLNYQTISARLKAGWPAETALTAPKKHGPRRELNL